MYKAIAVLQSEQRTEVGPAGYPGRILYESYSVAYGNSPADALMISLLGNEKHVKEVHVVWEA